jgi:glycosyltransferase involved in cell wall biosynthesis
MTDNRSYGSPLVSVVIPAFNASKTIARTLNSVLQQTYTNIEVVAVDDGSIDDTSEVVMRFVEQDSRVRLIRKDNGGVASARNAGIEAALGEFVAPIDADDLWHPTRVACHVSALLGAPADVGLVYSPFRRIDDNDRVLDSSPPLRVANWVLFRHLYVNLVGNGSGMTARRSVLVEVGGYQSWLKDLGAEGCEDFLLQLSIAIHYRFLLVPEYLIGYRDSPGNMSSDGPRMLRSQILALDAIATRCSNLPMLPFCLARLKYRTTLLIELLRRGRYSDLLRETDFIWTPEPSVIILIPLSILAIFGRAGRWFFHRIYYNVRSYTDVRELPSFYTLGSRDKPRRRAPPIMTLSLALLHLLDKRCACSTGYFQSSTHKNRNSRGSLCT